MIAAIYNRVSTEKQQQEGLSLQTQKEACIKYAKEHGYDVFDKYILDEVYSGLTIDRPKLDRLLGWIKNGEIEAIVFYSTDRFSRDGYDLLTLVRECDCNKVDLLCVSEDLGKGETGELINFIRGWASRLEATRIKERSRRNKRAKAERGGIASGYGKYGGFIGLQYDPDTEAFKHEPALIGIAEEILLRYAKGESASGITRDLQKRNIKSIGGSLFQISSVNRVLAHAKAYAGIVKFKDIEITGKVEPIISMEVANAILKQRQLNREHSFGFGKRKWFSGRVFCGVCGRRYVVSEGKSCRCNGDDRRNPTRCNNVRLPYGQLERLLSKALLFSYTDEEAVVARAIEVYQKWEQDATLLNERQRVLEERLKALDERKRKLSMQNELGGLNDEDYSVRLNTVKTQQDEILGNINDLQKFEEKPKPADPEKVRAGFNWLKRLKEQEPLLILLGKSPDTHKLGERLADLLNFKATIIPSDEGSKVEIRVDLPLEPIEIEEKSAQAIVIGSI